MGTSIQQLSDGAHLHTARSGWLQARSPPLALHGRRSYRGMELRVWHMHGTSSLLKSAGQVQEAAGAAFGKVKASCSAEI